MNLADPRSVRKSKQKEQLTRQRELDDLKAVCATPAGRRFVFQQLQESGVFALVFDAANAQMNAFYEGRRSMGITLFANLNELDSMLYPQMVKDAQRGESHLKSVDDAEDPYYPKEAIAVPHLYEEDANDE